MHTKWNHPTKYVDKLRHLTVHSLGRKSIYSAESHGSKEDKEEKENVFCQKVLDSTVMYQLLLDDLSSCVHILVHTSWKDCSIIIKEQRLSVHHEHSDGAPTMSDQSCCYQGALGRHQPLRSRKKGGEIPP